MKKLSILCTCKHNYLIGYEKKKISGKFVVFICSNLLHT